MIARVLVAASAILLAVPAQAAGGNIFVAPSGRVYISAKGEAYPSAVWFREVDLNHDNGISSAEFKADFASYFDSLDHDKNNILSVQEIHAYETGALRGIVGAGGSQTQISQGVAPIGEDDGTLTDQEQRAVKLNQQALSNDTLSGAGQFGLIPIPQPVSGMDMDFDGRVSRAEMQMAAARRFKLIAGSATTLTLSTLPKTAAQRR